MRILTCISVLALLAACEAPTASQQPATSQQPTSTEQAAALLESADPAPNTGIVSFEGSPNSTDVGLVKAGSGKVRIPVGTQGVLGGFRAGDCDAPPPDFKALMKSRVVEGLVVPRGVQLYDAGIGYFNSTGCGGRVAARAVGARVSAPGTYTLEFSAGQVVKTLQAPNS